MSDPISVLIVDDNASMAVSLADVLEVKGFTAYSASSGVEAIAILREHPVDILLTDVIMPGMNGVELYRETRQAHPHLTTFFMTAYSADDLIQQGMKEGIKTVLNKPLDIEFLILLLKSAGKRPLAGAGAAGKGRLFS
jgi:two-component system, NtrC family, response regulator